MCLDSDALSLEVDSCELALAHGGLRIWFFVGRLDGVISVFEVESDTGSVGSM